MHQEGRQTQNGKMKSTVILRLAAYADEGAANSGEVVIDTVTRVLSSETSCVLGKCNCEYDTGITLGETIRNACVQCGIEPETVDGHTRNVCAFAWRRTQSAARGIAAWPLSCLPPHATVRDSLNGCCDVLLLVKSTG